jgi:hypothetical protein
MTLTSLLSRSGTILSRTAGTALDTYGEPLQGTTSTAVACEVQQVQSDEPGDQGEFSVTGWKGYFPTGTTLDTGDAVSVSGMGTFEVVGEPWDANSGSSAVHHMEVSLRRTAGAA